MKRYNILLSRVVVVVLSVFLGSGTVFAGWVTPIDISNDRNYFAVDAHIAFDSNGHAHMAYQNFHDTVGGVWYTNNVSGTWATPDKIVETGGKPSGPRIVITPDEVIHIFWGKNGHYGMTRPVSGGNWSAPQRLDDVYQGGWFVAAVELANGGIYVAWLRLFDSEPEPRNALWGRYKPLGGDWGPEELIVQGTSDDNWPGGSWLKARGNEVYCTYNMSDAALYKIRSEGGTWSDYLVFDDDAGGVRFAWSPDGSEMAAAYAYDVDGDASQRWFEVFARFSYDDGQTWTPEYNVSDKVALDRNVEITYDPAGDFHTVWQDFACDGCQPEVSYRARINGDWQAKQNISNTPSIRSGIAHNAIQYHNDTLYLTYNESIDGFEDIYVTYNHLNLAPQDPGPVTSFTAQPGNQENMLTWTNPASGYYTATMIRYSTTDYPTDPQDGTLVVDKDGFPGSEDSYTHTGLDNGVTCYYTAFAHSWHPEYAAGVNASTTPHVPGDFDADNDIDIEDFGAFQLCLTGSYEPQDDPACIDALMDTDDDVDQADVSIFKNCLSGADVVVDPNCGP